MDFDFDTEFPEEKMMLKRLGPGAGEASSHGSGRGRRGTPLLLVGPPGGPYEMPFANKTDRPLSSKDQGLKVDPIDDRFVYDPNDNDPELSKIMEIEGLDFNGFLEILKAKDQAKREERERKEKEEERKAIDENLSDYFTYLEEGNDPVLLNSLDKLGTSSSELVGILKAAQQSKKEKEIEKEKEREKEKKERKPKESKKTADEEFFDYLAYLEGTDQSKFKRSK